MSWLWHTSSIRYRAINALNKLIKLSDPANDINTTVYGYLCTYQNGETIKIPLISPSHINRSLIRVYYNNRVLTPADNYAQITFNFTTSVISSGLYNYNRTFKVQLTSIYTTVKLPVAFNIYYRVGYKYYSYNGTYQAPTLKTNWEKTYQCYLTPNTFGGTLSKSYTSMTKNYPDANDISNFVWEIWWDTDTWNNKSYSCNGALVTGTGNNVGNYTRYISL